MCTSNECEQYMNTSRPCNLSSEHTANVYVKNKNENESYETYILILENRNRYGKLFCGIATLISLADYLEGIFNEFVMIINSWIFFCVHIICFLNYNIVFF